MRWFYEEPGKFWQPFNGYDSLTLEDTYRKLREKRGSADEYEVPVKGGLYEVNVLDRVCKPIYWIGELVDYRPTGKGLEMHLSEQ